MSGNSKIEWTNATWNPVRGCSIVSKGCTNCYAMRQAHRHNHPDGAYHGLTQLTKGGPVWNGEIRHVDELLEQPLHWKRPRRIFVNSMSDLFHDGVSDQFIDGVLTTIKRCEVLGRGHVFQVLTKRPQRMRDFMRNVYGSPAIAPMRNLWLGVSVEDQASADDRIPLLLQTPAAVRWISAEPLLGQVDLHLSDHPDDVVWRRTHGGGYERAFIGWVVAGGESGPGARPMHPDWVRLLRDECELAGVPFFFKQWGAWAPPEVIPKDKWSGKHTYVESEGLASEYVMQVGKATAGRLLDGRTHDGYPQ